MRRPRLAPGFTAIVDGDSLWLVAGEDVRYRLRLADPAWLRDLLARCDGSRTIDELAAMHVDARSTLERLVEERVLVEGTAAQAHAPAAADYRISGTGRLAELLRQISTSKDSASSTSDTQASNTPATNASGTNTSASNTSASNTDGAVEVFVQDRLDHKALLDVNRRMLDSRARWMWITTGPGGRAYVGPLFVPDAGPCAACLLVHFKRLSPAPELYDALIAHDGAIAATPFSDAALETVAAVARWKLSLAANPMAAALYALHVIEVGDLTVTAHVPLIDVECTQCR
jgi:bacteriocin biosynthesis cyclodehydratase domain-containing protein